MRIELTANVTDAATQRMHSLLDAHAESAGRPFSLTRMQIEAWEGDLYLGGLQAKLGTEWAFIELLAVAEDARGRGVGRRLMETIEAEARSRGLTGLWVDTFSFQAPDFYRRLGYYEFGRIDDYPKGSARLFFARRLDGTPQPS